MTKHKMGSITIVIVDEKKEKVSIKQISNNVFLIFPSDTDSRDELKEHVEKLIEDENIDSIELISHGKDYIKEFLENKGYKVTFYDITSIIQELYQRFRSLEKKFEDKEEFLNTLKEVKDMYKEIYISTLLKKVAHRLSGHVANLSLIIQLVDKNKMTDEEILANLENIYNSLNFLKKEVKSVKKFYKKIEDLENNLNRAINISVKVSKVEIKENLLELRKILQNSIKIIKEALKDENSPHR